MSLWLWQSNSVLILIHHFNSNFDCNICCFSRLELLSKPFKWYSIFFSSLFLVLVYVRPSSKTASWGIPLYHLWTHLRSSHCIHHQRPETKKFSTVFMRWNNLCKDNRSLPSRVFFKKSIKMPFNREGGIQLCFCYTGRCCSMGSTFLSSRHRELTRLRRQRRAKTQ